MSWRLGQPETSWIRSGMLIRRHASSREQREKQLVHYPLAAAIASNSRRLPQELRLTPCVVMNSVLIRDGAADIIVAGRDALIIIEAKLKSTPATFALAAEQLGRYAICLRNAALESSDWLQKIHGRSYSRHWQWAAKHGYSWSLPVLAESFGAATEWQNRLARLLEQRRALLVIASHGGRPAIAESAVASLKLHGWRAAAVSVNAGARGSCEVRWLAAPQ